MVSEQGTPRSHRPERLAKNDLIHSYSPSSSVPSFFPERLERGERELQRLGFRIERGDHATDRTGFTSGRPEDRASELEAAFLDPSVKAIHCTIGGHNSNQLLDLLDYDLIRSNPKILIGYSDCTALINAVWQMTNVVTYHGPGLLPEFGEYPHLFPYTEQRYLQTLTQAESSQEFLPPDGWTEEYAEWADPENATHVRATTAARWQPLQDGIVEGHLVGGNLSALLRLAGTPYWPDLNGAILFWEEANQPAALVDSRLTQLRQIGVFDQIAGMIIGRPYHCDDSTGVTTGQVVSDKLAGTSFPVLADVDLGHTDPMLTLPIGVRARLAVDGMDYSFGLVEASVH